MHGTTSQRLTRLVGHLAGHPVNAARWTRDRVSGRTAMARRLSWISYPCIDFLRKRMRQDLRVFEWGAGGSTLFFAGCGCRVTTVESAEEWARITRQQLAADGTDERVEFRTREPGADENSQAYGARFAAEVLEGGPWDLIFVDGEESRRVSRISCLEQSLAAPKADGALIVLDDAWRRPYEEATRSLLSGWPHQRFVGVGPDRPGVTRTDVYGPMPAQARPPAPTSC